jgi:hypothetical protein
MRQFPPSRIVCLTEETVETLYVLGEQDRIVGVSGYAVRPPQVRRDKPRISAFTSADIPKMGKITGSRERRLSGVRERRQRPWTTATKLILGAGLFAA